jgi:hypothetical protein
MMETPHRLHELIRLGRLGRLLYTKDPGDAQRTLAFRSHLGAKHVKQEAPAPLLGKHANEAFRALRGWHQEGNVWARELDLGSGLVTNIGVLALCGDSQWPQTSIVTNLFKLLKYHASGKGVTAAAVPDFRIETDSTVGGQTPVIGTQLFTHDQVGIVQKWVSVATIAYTGGEAVTEWGLFNDATLSRTLGSPLTSVTANSATGTGSVWTASAAGVQGETQHVINTGTTPRIALITSNTTNVATLSFGAASGWMVSTTGVIGSTPGGTETFTLRPVMWDHKVFAAINVVNLDSIQFTYTLTIASGG